MSAYYNENDPKAAAWLRELIKAGLIAPGDVDERSITEVQPNDLRPYTQCHFFAGIGGWSYALRLAGVRDDEPAWTGSCPCQPFSAAGKQLGTADARHLWPVWFGLISQCGPSIIFGEQVASKAGREWYYTGVRPDVESLGYAAGCADLCAAGVCAPHIRQRLWWMAVAGSQPTGRMLFGPRESDSTIGERASNQFGGSGSARGMADADGGHPGKEWEQRSGQQRQQPEDGGAGHWSRFEIIPCLDGKSRRIESGTFPLAHGVSGRVGLLRGYGNAIVPQVAAEFIRAAFEAIPAPIRGHLKRL